MSAHYESKVNDRTPMAPTVSIEQVPIVRAIKVVALLCTAFGVFFNCLSVGATTWFKSDTQRHGLWEACSYLNDDVILCQTISPIEDWKNACRILFVMGMVVALLAVIVTAVGLTTQVFHRKIKYYVIGMILMLLAAIFEMTCLILYPVKYSEITQTSWGLGWAYGLGWISAILMTTGSILLFIDRNADELVYRETTNCNESIEEYDA